MNHCILEVEVTKVPTLRYTQDNKTPIAEMEVQFDGLRADDAPSKLKVVGWGNMAEELQNRAQDGQRLVVEGRLRMNMVPREDGSKEKKAELTLSKMHPVSPQSFQAEGGKALSNRSTEATFKAPTKTYTETKESNNQETEDLGWNSAPLVPDTDDIPF